MKVKNISMEAHSKLIKNTVGIKQILIMKLKYT